MATNRLAAEMGLSGKFGPMVVCRRGKTAYLRRPTKPKNPKSPKQRAARGKLREAVVAWKSLPASQRRAYSDRARLHGRTGYNLFVSEYLGGEGRASPASPSRTPMAPRELLAACLEAVLRVAADGNTDVLRMALDALLRS